MESFGLLNSLMLQINKIPQQRSQICFYSYFSRSRAICCQKKFSFMVMGIPGLWESWTGSILCFSNKIPNSHHGRVQLSLWPLLPHPYTPTTLAFFLSLKFVKCMAFQGPCPSCSPACNTLPTSWQVWFFVIIDFSSIVPFLGCSMLTDPRKRLPCHSLIHYPELWLF